MFPDFVGGGGESEMTIPEPQEFAFCRGQEQPLIVVSAVLSLQDYVSPPQ